MPSHTDVAETHGSGGRFTDGFGNLSPPKLLRLGAIAALVVLQFFIDQKIQGWKQAWKGGGYQ